MKSIAALLTGVLLLGFTACSDTIVGTDADVAPPEFKKGGDNGPPGGGGPADPGVWAVSVTFSDRTGDQIRSDAEIRPDLTGATYTDGECGVMAEIGNLDDVRFDPDWSYTKKYARTCGEARLIVFEFDDKRSDQAFGAFMNIDGLCTITVGDSRTGIHGQFNVGLPLEFENLSAVRSGSATWLVSTDAIDGGLATKGDGTTHTMPFELTITALDPDPCP